MISDGLLSSIGVADLQQLKENGTRENRRLDFKQTLDLGEREKRVELLRDIVAMANADGGTIVFGVEEGEDDDRGVVTGIPGIEINIDDTSNTVDSLVRDNIDERLTVQQHHVTLPDNKTVYLIRVPASALAPHMITSIRTSLPRFYSRAITSNEPMTARQRKVAALRHGAAVERASERIKDRVAELKRRSTTRQQFNEPADANQLIFHAVPLFPQVGAWNYGDPRVTERLMHVRPFGGSHDDYGNLKFTQHGAFQEYTGRRHTGFLRDGTLEGQEYDIATTGRGNDEKFVFGSEILASVNGALLLAEKLSGEGMLPAPLLLQLHLLDVRGSWFQLLHNSRSSIGNGAIADDAVETDAFVLTDWSERNRVLKNLLDHVWQAWGIATCGLFEPDGSPMEFDDNGYRIPRG
jgi:hypothetical protein